MALKLAPLRATVSLGALILSAGAALAGPDAMTPEEARHLIARTGFGAAPAEIKDMTGNSYAEGVEALLASISTAPSTPMPEWTSRWAYPAGEVETISETAAELFYANRFLEIEDLARWWMAEMIATPSPLTERLTLFWHDHFATSFESWENSQWMAAQNQMFRAEAAGSFATLAAGILRDPAMLTYLSNTENAVEAPNENLAREYLELFTLGQGRGYTEADVKEVARTLTGHGISDNGTGYRFWPDMHDYGEKAILGQRGRFGAEDLPAIVLNSPAFGPYIVEKLWRSFISDTPDPAEVARLARLWRDSQFEMKPLLRAMFLSEAFWDPQNRGRLVKSPVELLVGAVRSFGIAGLDLRDLSYAAEDMGQVLFFPPNVSGWTEGVGWITDATALTRAAAMTALVGVIEHGPEALGPAPGGMMAAPPRAVAEQTSPEDLRVGRVFVPWAERFSEDGAVGTEVGVTLFDVSFAGRTWRSLPLALGVWGDEEPFVAFDLSDCAPDCLRGLDRDWLEEGTWLGFDLHDALAEDLEEVPASLKALATAVLKHLPQMLSQTQDHAIWTWVPEEDEAFVVPSHAETRALVDTVAQMGRHQFGPGSAAYVAAASAPGLDGLSGLTVVRSLDDIDGYYDQIEDRHRRMTAPAVVYDSAEAWVADLPQGTTPQDALLAVPIGGFADGAAPLEALRAVVLSPAYQLK